MLWWFFFFSYFTFSNALINIEIRLKNVWSDIIELYCQRSKIISISNIYLKVQFCLNSIAIHCLKWNLVIMNSSGPAIFVRYNRGFIIIWLTCLLTRPISPKNRVFVNNRPVVSKFYCKLCIPVPFIQDILKSARVRL